MTIFSDYIGNFMEMFMYDFSNFGSSFDVCFTVLSIVLKRCEEVNLVLSWKKSHFMVQEGIVLGHKVSKKRIEVDKAKVDLISNLSMPSFVKQVTSFLDHAGFYRRFVKDFSIVARPLTNLLTKDTPFVIDESCVKAYEKLRSSLVSAPIVQPPDFSLPFEIMLSLIHI